MNFEKVQDSGERRKFITGSQRDSHEGKGRYDLITPVALKRLAIHYENGAKKYDDNNWMKGQPLHVFLDSALRHINTYRLNTMLGKPQEEDHLAAALWNIAALIHTEEMIALGKLPKELDDLARV